MGSWLSVCAATLAAAPSVTPAIRFVPVVTLTGLVLLWLSALVTLYTGWDYFRAGVRHLMEE